MKNIYQLDEFFNNLGYERMYESKENIPDLWFTDYQKNKNCDPYDPKIKLRWCKRVMKEGYTHDEYHVFKVDYYYDTVEKFVFYIERDLEYSISISYQPLKFKMSLSTYIDNFETLNVIFDV